MEFIDLKDQDWFAKQKIAGKCVSSVLKKCTDLIINKTPNLSLKDLENVAIEIIKDYDCIPTFKNYNGPVCPFPSAICTSVNEQLVHGIVTDYILKDGDVVSIDLGATYNEVIADAAYTSVYGEPKSKQIIDLLKSCQNALKAGIDAVRVGNRIGAIGYAINNCVKNSGFGLVTNYGGHGLTWNKAHASPFVANRARSDEGIRIQPGLTIAIEPMLTIGSPQNKILSDGWTVVTEDIGCHFEHTIYVEDENNIHIMTEHGMDVGSEKRI